MNRQKSDQDSIIIRSTTILCIRRNGKVVMAGDGQVTFGQTIMKANARKVRKMYKDSIVAGFAGTSADAFALLGKLEAKLEEYRGNLSRASVELAKEWRMDKVLRRLEAMLAVADREHFFIISGAGDVIEPSEGVMAIGSGGAYALAAARALLLHTDMEARQIVEEAMKITSSICIYTNNFLTIEEI
ncbi:MAG: ATP-dependent protease subunit HslV [bacterium]|nr:ATP-dependent protease subunit HslV [bacterium]